MSQSDDETLRFIEANFPSVWALELALALKREARPCTSEQLVAMLRASELVVSKALEALVVAGIASPDAQGSVYLPANPDIDECMARTEQLYRARPNTVRRAIISASTGGAAAFADAFKLRRNRDD